MRGCVLKLQISSLLLGRLDTWKPPPAELTSYTVYRWASTVRASAELGVVGVGGLGQMLCFHLGLFQMAETCSILLAISMRGGLVDAASYAVRWFLQR